MAVRGGERRKGEGGRGKCTSAEIFPVEAATMFDSIDIISLSTTLSVRAAAALARDIEAEPSSLAS